jgi:biopolymer transport protein ExbB
MKKSVLLIAFIFLIPSFSFSRDIRELSVLAREKYQKSVEEQKELKRTIFKNKAELNAEIKKLENSNTETEKKIKELAAKTEALSQKRIELEKISKSDQSDIEELTGAVRISARELQSVIDKSVFTAFDPERAAKVKPILDKKIFPGIEDMQKIASLFLEEAELSGSVTIKPHTYINKQGEKTTGDILTIGGFTNYYEKGFLNYSGSTNTFYSLSKDPSFFIKNNIKKYFNGKSDSIYADISGGGAFAQLIHKQSLIEKIKKGGFLVLPILGIGLAAVLIGLERAFFIARVHGNTDTVMGRVNELAEKGKWDECSRIVGNEKKKPVYNVLRQGLEAKNEDRETLESILQESILKELPKLEKFLPLLNILGAIAPLLGLLGTVTGMINTFQVITVYGTGDPRMMSGGISTALVTTMLGLSVAIPIMLLHTFLSRRVDHVIGDMEEKAVALSNIIFRDRNL